MSLKNSVPIITIDGPSGTGKGTICHMLASYLKWNVLDSGSLYRVLALAARKEHLNLSEKGKLVELANHLNIQFETDADYKINIYLNQKEVTKELRSEQCGQDASVIAAIPEIRIALLDKQRHFATAPGLVTDGRDMGTVVFPHADLKIFLDASEQERALRRYNQLKDSQINVSLAQVVDELAKRDSRDKSRTTAPLKPADDAVYIDTTGLSIVQVFNYVVQLVKERAFC